MKAVLALIVIYVGTFLVAIQGASQNPVQPSPDEASASASVLSPAASADPAKESDVRSLVELLGPQDAGKRTADELVAIYSSHYSESEIRELLRFYSSPLGRKALAEAPKIAREAQTIGRAATPAASPAKSSLEAMKLRPPVLN